MKEFFKWLLVIILGILACPFLLAVGGFIIVLLAIIATLITITAPLWVPVMAIGLMVDLIDNCCE